jgi:hypothetical protein
MLNKWQILVVKPAGNRHLGDLGIDIWRTLIWRVNK